MGSRRGARRGLSASFFGFALVVACNQRFDFDVPESGGGTAGAGGSPTGGATSGGATSGGAPGGRAGCSGDADCSFASLYCNVSSYQCVECLTDAHCGTWGLARCDTATHRCVECGLALDCDDDEACEPTSRRCVQRCTEDRDCAEVGGACDLVRGMCVECRDEDDCERAGIGSHCQGVVGRCTQCDDADDCGALFCDPILFACVECRTSADCGGRLCDPSAHRCI